MVQDLKERITYLIGYERSEGLIDNLSSEELSKRLNVPQEEIEQAQKELELI